MKADLLKNYIKKTENLKSLIYYSDTDFISLGYFNKNVSRKNISKELFTLMYVISGYGSYIDSNKQTYELKPGVLVLRHPGCKHSIIRDVSHNWNEFYIVLPEYFYVFLKKSRSLPDFDFNLLPPHSQWLNTLKALIEKCRQFTLNNKERAFPEIQQFFLGVKDKLSHKRKYQSGQNEILEICRIIEERPGSRTTNKDLASKAGFGQEHFRKLFKEIVGCAPQEYIIYCRVQKAQKYLIEDKLRLENIAFNLGYPDLPSFSRQFKKVTSLSPSEFKKMINEN